MPKPKIFMIIFLGVVVIEVASAETKPKQAVSVSSIASNRFDEWTWLTSHNSHLNWHDSSVVYLVSNQNMSIDEQLTHGVRGFMLDIGYNKCSYLDQLFSTCNCEGVCLCHGECSSNSFKDGFAMKSLAYALRKLVSFLIKNKNEIITVFLEDYIRDTSHLTQVFRSVKNMQRLVFNPYAPEWDVLKNGWPRIGDMIAANKRLLIVDDEQRALHASNKNVGVIRSRDFFIQNHYEWTIDNDDDYSENSNNRTVVNLKNHSHSKNSTKKYFNKSYIDESGQNQTLSLRLPRCYSVHRTRPGKPNWDEHNKLELSAREHAAQLTNGQKLFLFNHFYGIPAKGVLDGQTHIFEYINSSEFIRKRLREKCDPYTSRKRPNFIALDFIGETTYNDLIAPFNINPY